MYTRTHVLPDSTHRSRPLCSVVAVGIGKVCMPSTACIRPRQPSTLEVFPGTICVPRCTTTQTWKQVELKLELSFVCLGHSQISTEQSRMLSYDPIDRLAPSIMGRCTMGLSLEDRDHNSVQSANSESEERVVQYHLYSISRERETREAVGRGRERRGIENRSPAALYLGVSTPADPSSLRDVLTPLHLDRLCEPCGPYLSIRAGRHHLSHTKEASQRLSVRGPSDERIRRPKGRDGAISMRFVPRCLRSFLLDSHLFIREDARWSNDVVTNSPSPFSSFTSQDALRSFVDLALLRRSSPGTVGHVRLCRYRSRNVRHDSRRSSE